MKQFSKRTIYIYGTLDYTGHSKACRSFL